jgi:hypothetical protein
MDELVRRESCQNCDVLSHVTNRTSIIDHHDVVDGKYPQHVVPGRIGVQEALHDRLDFGR